MIELSLQTAMLVGLACVCFEAFFSGSEIAVVSASRTRLRKRAHEGDRGAAMAEKYLHQPQTLLATTLMGTNLATVTFSVTVALALLSSDLPNSEILSIALVTPMTLIFGELVPKTLFQQYADRIVTRIIYPLHVASLILRPGVWIMSAFAGAMTRILGTDRARAFITRDELALLLESEATDSEITDEEREMVANVLELWEDTVHDVMVPLSEVTALPEDTTLGNAALEIADKEHSRLPVFRTRIDDIVGIVHVFDLLQAGPGHADRTVSEVAKPATFVPENMPAADLLVELQATGNHMAIVVDEYGGAVGIVTVEDLLEEIVGEIEDEYDKGPSPVRAERPGVWRVEARTSVERINHDTGLELPESDEYETIAGLMLEHFKRIPEPGESLVVDGVTIRVVAASDRAVEEVQLLRRRRK